MRACPRARLHPSGATALSLCGYTDAPSAPTAPRATHEARPRAAHACARESAPLTAVSALAARPRAAHACARESAPLVAGERVFSTYPNRDGSRALIASRDKLVGLYDCTAAATTAWRDAPSDDGRGRLSEMPRWAPRRGESTRAAADGSSDDEGDDARAVWLIHTDDSIYSAALSTDERLAAIGGRSMVVSLLDGVTGRPLYSVQATGTIWSVRLLDLATSPASPSELKLVYGGEFANLTVMDVASRQEELHMPVAEVSARADGLRPDIGQRR